jgi:FkbM family methyltransferase
MTGTDKQENGSLPGRLLHFPVRLLVRILAPVTRHWRSHINTLLQEQLHQVRLDHAEQVRLSMQAGVNSTISTLHGVIDAGVIALAARMSVIDATLATSLARLSNVDAGVATGLARLDTLDSDLAALAYRMEHDNTRLDRQQRVIFDGMLDELALARTDNQAAVATLRPIMERLEQYSYASARRVAVGCTGDVLVRSEAGYILCAGSDHSVLSTLIDSGELERGTRLLIESLLRPGDCFVDVGANIGMHTLAAGRAMHRTGTIHAFEPFEATRLLLQQSVWMNGLAGMTVIHSAAASDRTGTQTLFLGASSGHHSLVPLGQDGAHTEVQTVRLDDVVTVPVTLLKIDAEGVELDVLAGARQLIADNEDIALIVEFGPSHLMRTGHTTAGWLAQFSALGLVWRSIDAVSGRLSEPTLAVLEAADSTNLFLARPGACCWSRLEQ